MAGSSPHEPARMEIGECLACGFVFHPFQSYGCERCGEDGPSLVSRVIAGRGRVEATALVQRHADPARPTPFLVVEVALDEGPVVRGLADRPDALRAGDRTRAVLVRVPAGDGQRDEIRFAKEGSDA